MRREKGQPHHAGEMHQTQSFFTSLVVHGYAFTEMHFGFVNAIIMLYFILPIGENELLSAPLVEFELLTTWIARGDFVPPSVTAQSELPVLHYISSCCFYGGLVEPVQLLHFLSEWASNSLLSEWASMVDGGKVRSWICVNFARNVQDSVFVGSVTHLRQERILLGSLFFHLYMRVLVKWSEL